MRRIALFLFVIITVLTAFNVCGCSKKSDDELIRERIDSFLEAYNTGDLNAVLECMDTKSRNTYKSAIGLTEAIGGKITNVGGVTLSDLFGLGVGVVSEGDILSENIQKVNIEDESNAIVDVTMSYNDKTQSASDKATFVMLKEDNDWYIKDLKDR